MCGGGWRERGELLVWVGVYVQDNVPMIVCMSIEGRWVIQFTRNRGTLVGPRVHPDGCYTCAQCGMCVHAQAGVYVQLWEQVCVVDRQVCVCVFKIRTELDVVTHIFNPSAE